MTPASNCSPCIHQCKKVTTLGCLAGGASITMLWTGRFYAFSRPLPLKNADGNFYTQKGSRRCFCTRAPLFPWPIPSDADRWWDEPTDGGNAPDDTSCQTGPSQDGSYFCHEGIANGRSCRKERPTRGSKNGSCSAWLRCQHHRSTTPAAFS